MQVNRIGRLSLAAVAVGAVVALAGCGTSDSVDGGSDAGEASGPLVVGSQDYYSNEIIAEIYAQALEANGFEVEREFRIGQREVYIPEIESGAIDVFPEYTGNLLQYYVPDTTATTSDDVYAELTGALPDGLSVLDQAPATDQDSYNVTQAFADEYGVTSLADLADVPEELTLGGNSELETRPYGPEGLAAVYGVEVGFTAIEDSGGPLTIKALQDDAVQLVNIFSANPAIATSELVTLEDPEGLFLASNVVPVVSERVDAEVAEVINAVSAALTAEDLVALNSESVDEQRSASDIAADWLTEQGLA
ncbi:glycine/betaine ABC transporter permease [Agromyces rhizosphaerae]|uniref:Glycine/betaine ABC transporter permease n=1 Tax=Agromyces rhizosphaerae TaxID=88374 RepID=A0A9W6FSS3_9MICO|nr:ABC transporter substrate-binding protein [Agromyces rhizosphaerae]GLI29057.1 glycine/betaine ABC transporter permease [Agromyces rhizosphaerae]